MLVVKCEKMFRKIVLVFTILKLAIANENKVLYYDSYKGEKITAQQYEGHVVKNTTFWCTNVLEPCDPNEWRRIDGSCNNLDYPNRGMPHTPTMRLLPPFFSGNGQEGYEPRTAQSGEPLPNARELRTSILPEARIPDPLFTQLVSHFLMFLIADVLSIHDTVNFILWKPYCCLPEGKKDRDCTPVEIPKDDPVHRFGHLRCMRLTRPFSFQSQGCVDNTTKPEKIISSTPTIDLSHIYGSSVEVLNQKGRLFEKGLLKYEMLNGAVWPPSTKTKENFCLLNRAPMETRCHDTPDSGFNGLLGINFSSILFWRLHNYIANALAKINPCWDDDKLFYTARDINIAIASQIAYYELWPSLMGYDNMIKAGVISYLPGFRDFYNPKFLPQLSKEYVYTLRWFHTIQENELKMYDAKGNYLKSVPLTSALLRTGWLAIDDNLKYITQGCFRQAGGRFDHLVDPDIAEIGVGPLTDGTDLTAFDLVKNRYYGMAPYIDYVKLCSGRKIETFEDLTGFIKPEMIDILKDKYKHVKNIDLMAGLWVELPAEGSFLPRTLHCLITEQLERYLVSDRHWYERPNRPHAFNSSQLYEIRKATIARVLCNVGDSVTEIQPSAFVRAGQGNEMVSCDLIPDIDFSAWKDPSCCKGSNDKHSSSQYRNPCAYATTSV